MYMYSVQYNDQLYSVCVPGIEGKLGLRVIMEGCIGGGAGGARTLEGAFREGSSGL